MFIQTGENTGDGVFNEPLEMETFDTPGVASAYIQMFWLGPGWVESPHVFYSDMAIYTLANFSLHDIGKFVKEPGKNWQYYVFNPVTEADREEADDKHSRGNFRKPATCEKCGSSDLQILDESTWKCGSYKCRACGGELTWID